MTFEGLAQPGYWIHPRDNSFAEALDEAGVDGLQITSKDLDIARRPVVPDDLADSPTRLISGEQKIGEEAYANVIPTVQHPLSPEAADTSTKAGKLLYPYGFAAQLDAVQAANAASFAEDDYFNWRMPFDKLHERSQKTTVFLREPTTERDEEFEQFTEVPNHGGSKSLIKNEIFVDVVPGDVPRTLFNAAYSRLESLKDELHTKNSGITRIARTGMEIKNEAAVRAEQIPAAEILQRGLTAYDALQMVASVDMDAAKTLLATPESIPDYEYMKFIHGIAGTRPVAHRHGADNEHTGLMRAGVDLSALRAMAYSDDLFIYGQAKLAVSFQAEDSFGPEFLQMLQTVNSRYRTEEDKTAMLRWLNWHIEQDQRRGSQNDPSKVGRIMLHETVETLPDPTIEGDDEFDYSIWSYTVPYASTAIAMEDLFQKADAKGHSDRYDRIEAAVVKKRAFKQMITGIYADIAARDNPADITETDGNVDFSEVLEPNKNGKHEIATQDILALAD